MPATFAHCLMTKKAIDILLNKPGGHPYIRLLGEKNHFAITGSTGPDYPYLTNPVYSGELKSVHSWADRMHYENVGKFIKEGVAKLSTMDKGSDEFEACLPWLLGYVSHVIADSYVHPVINCIVGGPYIFTHADHAKCEMIQDVYIFQDFCKVDIVDADPRNDPHFGFLTILDECSEPGAADQLNHFVRDFWRYLLRFAHPQGEAYFDAIIPDEWHKNYRKRMGNDADASFMFRHACGAVGISTYKRMSDVTAKEMSQFIENIPLPVPGGKTANYKDVIDNAVARIISTWEKLFDDIDAGTAENIATYIKDWNLDTGVDEEDIYLWSKGGTI